MRELTGQRKSMPITYHFQAHVAMTSSGFLFQSHIWCFLCWIEASRNSFPKGSCAPLAFIYVCTYFFFAPKLFLITYLIKDLDKFFYIVCTRLEISSEQYWLRTSTYKIKGSYDRKSTDKNWTFVIMHMAFAPKLFWLHQIKDLDLRMLEFSFFKNPSNIDWESLQAHWR